MACHRVVGGKTRVHSEAVGESPMSVSGKNGHCIERGPGGLQKRRYPHVFKLSCTTIISLVTQPPSVSSKSFRTAQEPHPYCLGVVTTNNSLTNTCCPSSPTPHGQCVHPPSLATRSHRAMSRLLSQASCMLAAMAPPALPAWVAS
jgi:hypothetical protein